MTEGIIVAVLIVGTILFLKNRKKDDTEGKGGLSGRNSGISNDEQDMIDDARDEAGLPEEPAQPASIDVDAYKKMTKANLVKAGADLGVELKMSMTKADMLSELQKIK